MSDKGKVLVCTGAGPAMVYHQIHQTEAEVCRQAVMELRMGEHLAKEQVRLQDDRLHRVNVVHDSITVEILDGPDSLDERTVKMLQGKLDAIRDIEWDVPFDVEIEAAKLWPDCEEEE